MNIRAEISTHSPIQAREDTLYKVERMIPLLIAESLTRIREYNTGIAIPRIDIWNNVSRKIDDQYFIQRDFTNRFDYSSSLIQRRYETLEKLFEISQKNRIIIRDDSNEYQRESKTITNRNLNEGRFIIEKAEVIFCPRCQKMIALKKASVTRCVCGGTKFEIESKEVMFMNFTDDDKDAILKRVRLAGGNRVLTNLKQRILPMPNKILVSKQRDYGFSLGYLGLDLVLDPKIAVSYFPEVVLEMTSHSTETVVQGIDTSAHTIPYTLVLCNTDINPEYLLTRKVMQFNPLERPIMDGFYFPFIPLLSSSMTSDLEANTIIGLKNEFDRTTNKYSNIIKLLKLAPANTIENLTPDEISKLNKSLNLIDSLDFRKASLILRDFIYNVLSKKYGSRLKTDGIRLSTDTLAKLDRIISLIYG